MSHIRCKKNINGHMNRSIHKYLQIRYSKCIQDFMGFFFLWSHLEGTDIVRPGDCINRHNYASILYMYISGHWAFVQDLYTHYSQKDSNPPIYFSSDSLTLCLYIYLQIQLLLFQILSIISFTIYTVICCFLYFSHHYGLYRYKVIWTLFTCFKQKIWLCKSLDTNYRTLCVCIKA